ncbi:putative porin [Ferrimonas gelatinilytica]|uniref:Uncharacterized protein n=1 Tax=Ferrimonas gelatinilytica TaxID=1255257 RepID=A0ABP9S144_9GAMM
MKRILLGALVGAGTLLPALAQGEFQHEASAAVGSKGDGFGDGFWRIRYDYAFSPIKVGNQPYALARYLSPASSVRASYSEMDDFDSFSVGGTYQSPSGWFGLFNYTRNQLEQLDQDEYEGGIGYYLTDTTTLTATYGRYERDYFATESEFNRYGLSLRHYFPLQTTQGLDTEFGYTRVDDDHRFPDGRYQVDGNLYYARADWYITQSWFIGARYGYSDIGDDDDSWIVQTGYWWQIGRVFSLQALVGHEFNTFDDDLTLGLGFTARF